MEYSIRIMVLSVFLLLPNRVTTVEITATVSDQVVYVISRAERGDAKAQYNLGNMYADGLVVPEDYNQAIGWFEKSAAHGNADAQYMLGLHYADGPGGDRNYTRAREWFEKAAAQGHTGAQYNLGEIYQRGLGVNVSISTAVEWYRKACDNGVKAECENYKLLDQWPHS